MNEHPGQLGAERDRLRVLLDVATAVANELDLHALFRAIGKELRRVVPHEWTNLALDRDEPGFLRLHALIAPDGRGGPEGIQIPIAGSPAGLAFTTRRPFVASSRAELLAAIELDGLRTIVESYGIRSGCFVPLISRGRVLGTVGFGSDRDAVFGEESVQLLYQIAAQIAPAIDNALAYDRVEALKRQLAAERDRLRVLLEVTSAVARELEVGALFHAIRRALLPVVPHDWTHLALHDEVGGLLRLHTIPGPEGQPDEQVISIDGTPAGRAFRVRAPFVADVREEIVAVGAPETDARGARSCCFVPLVSRGRAVGSVGFGSGRERAFDRASIELLEQIAAHIAPAIDNALAYRRVEALKEQLAKEKVYLEDQLRSETNAGELVGQSKALRRTLAAVETVAATTSTVLIQGETGTGKELVARAIHEMSGRGGRTFVKLNCAAIPTGLLESELFGHEKGAFTGAVAAKVGRFELAHEGSLFLDEIGEIPSELQPKLLRVLQDQEFERLGGTKTIKADVRVIAATNRDLAQMVAARQFRSDLYYRLNVFPISVPPLRERPGDVPLLVRHFVQRFARRMGKRIETIPAESLDALERHAWPGNVRELEHLVERSVILTKGLVLQVPLGELRAHEPAHAPPAAAPPEASGGEREAILEALHACGWRVGGAKGAAARLGLSRTTLQSKMLRLGIVRPG